MLYLEVKTQSQSQKALTDLRVLKVAFPVKNCKREPIHSDGLSGSLVMARPVEELDRQGNLYVSGPGGAWIISPEGKHLGTIKTPELPANFAWGDADGQTLYMTARTSHYRIRLNIPGVRP